MASSVEPARDLGEARACCPLVTDAGDDLVGNSLSSSWPPRRSRDRASDLPPFGEKPLQLVDWNEARSPVHLQRLDEREDPPVERRGTDTEGLRSLASGVGKPLDAFRLEDD